MPEPVLTVTDIHVRFGGVHSLRGVSLEVQPGKIVGLIGPNGAGKTTMFNVVSGLVRPDSGRVSAFGQDVTALPAYRRARLGIGRSFQNLGLCAEESIEFNLLAAQFGDCDYGPADLLLAPWRRTRSERELHQRAVRALRLFDVHADLREIVGSLSFGVARRVELAGLVARQPALVLLDEPTTGLDTEESDLLRDCLRRQVVDGTTILVVAHDVSFVLDMCDEVYVLAEGSILFHGTPNAARSDERVIESFLGAAA
jgi:branched-chain amino acid transport system ATP-binding protein